MKAGDIQHDAVGKQFHLRTENGMAHLDYDQVGDDTLDFKSVFVPAQDRGRGIAGRIVEEAFAYASDHGLLVIPSCPYVRSWVGKNPGFAGRVDPRFAPRSPHSKD